MHLSLYLYFHRWPCCLRATRCRGTSLAASASVYGRARNGCQLLRKLAHFVHGKYPLRLFSLFRSPFLIFSFRRPSTSSTLSRLQAGVASTPTCELIPSHHPIHLFSDHLRALAGAFQTLLLPSSFCWSSLSTSGLRAPDPPAYPSSQDERSILGRDSGALGPQAPCLALGFAHTHGTSAFGKEVGFRGRVLNLLPLQYPAGHPHATATSKGSLVVKENGEIEQVEHPAANTSGRNELGRENGNDSREFRGRGTLAEETWPSLYV